MIAEYVQMVIVVMNLTVIKIVQVCAGYYHTLALTTEQRLLSWGEGSHGQLGLGDTEDRHTYFCVEQSTGEA